MLARGYFVDVDVVELMRMTNIIHLKDEGSVNIIGCKVRSTIFYIGRYIFMDCAVRGVLCGVLSAENDYQ